MKFDTKTIAMNAIIAAVYAALTIMLAPISYGAVQMRIAEVMVFLAFYNKKYIPGLVLGCFIANIPSTLGAWDLCFGTLATLIAVSSISVLPNRYLGALAGALANGLIVGAELAILFPLSKVFAINFAMNAGYVFIGELIVLVVGAFVFGLIEKNEKVKNILEMA